MNELPIGCIFCYPSAICPAGFLPCDGRELSKSLYPELYKLIKGTWGETGKSFFLPDLRGQFIRGWDDGGGVDPESGADYVRSLGSEQQDALQGHSHAVDSKVSTSSCAGSHSHSFYLDEHGGGLGTLFDCLSTRKTYKAKNKAICRESSESAGYHSHSFQADVTVLDVIDSTNGRVRISTETRPKNVSLMFCMKVK